MRRRDYIGPVLCALGAACMLAALAVDLDSTAAKVLMVAAAVLFIPGAYTTPISTPRWTWAARS